DAKLALLQAAALGIPVPIIKKVIPCETGFELIQTRIHGQDLMDVWPSIGLFQTIHIALQLRWIVRRMRSVTRSTAGSLGTGICRSFFLDNDAYGIPNHASPTMTSYIVNFWHNHKSFRKEASKTAEEHRESCPEPTTPEELAFTHHDLVPRNIMIENKTEKLWVVDWDFAGFYPPCFEHAAMHNFILPPEWPWFARWRWRVVVWITTGLHRGKLAMLERMRSRSIRFPASRRFNIKAGATECTKEVKN
ncbi:uncharacterized protein C8A04DRAFT_10339, partial [Dichotomopilus funicola]